MTIRKKSMTAACATDDGKLFADRHFGDALFYDIYLINSDSTFSFVKRIENAVEEENLHADPKKAQSIAGLLKAEGVEVTLSKMYGPNLKRIRKKFVCIKTDTYAIADALRTAAEAFSRVHALWVEGEERSHLTLKTAPLEKGK